MKYHHRIDGTPVNAVQFTDSKSVRKIHEEFACSVVHRPAEGLIIVDGTQVARGDYAVQAFPAIVTVDREVFDSRFKKDETQLEMFDELR